MQAEDERVSGAVEAGAAAAADNGGVKADGRAKGGWHAAPKWLQRLVQRQPLDQVLPSMHVLPAAAPAKRDRFDNHIQDIFGTWLLNKGNGWACIGGVCAP